MITLKTFEQNITTEILDETFLVNAVVRAVANMNLRAEVAVDINNNKAIVSLNCNGVIRKFQVRVTGMVLDV